jgi:hypothetical protein
LSAPRILQFPPRCFLCNCAARKEQSTKLKVKVSSPFTHRLELIYQLFFNDELEDNAHNTLVDTVMLTRIIVRYIERVDNGIEQETVDGLQLIASKL